MKSNALVLLHVNGVEESGKRNLWSVCGKDGFAS